MMAVRSRMDKTKKTLLVGAGAAAACVLAAPGQHAFALQQYGGVRSSSLLRRPVSVREGVGADMPAPVGIVAGGAIAAGLVGSIAKRSSRKSSRQLSTATSAVMNQQATQKLTQPAPFLDGVDIFIFDCDGVIWRGDSLIEGIPNVLTKLRQAGKKIFFVTNNSTKSRAGYKGKFTSLGLDVNPEEIFSSSFAAAAYLEKTNFKATGKRVYIIGERGISEELDLIGVPWAGAESFKDMVPFMGSGGKMEIDEDVGAVIVGFDRHINYYKLQYAQLCLNELPGCQFIATNLDRVTHLTDAQEWAGNGTMVGAVEGCTGMKAHVVGKPAPLMIEYLEEKFGIKDRSRICMVGDRLDTDIAFGQNNGLQTVLTLSGVTTEDELLNKVPRKSGTEGIDPEFYVETINDFFP
mmetsp:Transcript_30174/g.69416  ORF Transcript_30174/g.69416 Transcript_30174/m.69416 type:complete len:407 (+) Transcript_30174:68-1288(+)